MGTNTGDYGVTSNCLLYPNSLAGGTSRTIRVAFTPGNVGIRTAKIVTKDDANNTPERCICRGRAMIGWAVGGPPIFGPAPFAYKFPEAFRPRPTIY